MKRYPIIQADVFAKNVGTEEQRQQLIKEAWDAYYNNDATLGFSNRGCWRSHFKYKDIEWLIAEIRDLVNVAIQHYQDQDPIYKEKTNLFGAADVSYWTNINQIGSKNSLHEHKSYHYVAVYYLQGTSTGDIIFSNPSNLTEGCNPYAPFVSTMAFSPNDGDLYVWPAWLPHETDINNSDRNRISIAFNIRFQAPQNIYNEKYY
jgi:uncharacterized protein (TIGR02466 family)